jgi:hypothetical protein
VAAVRTGILTQEEPSSSEPSLPHTALCQAFLSHGPSAHRSMVPFLPPHFSEEEMETQRRAGTP